MLRDAFTKILIIVLLFTTGCQTMMGQQSDPVLMDPASIQDAQTNLNRLGYDVGKADGIFGRQTADKMQQYQQDYGLPQTDQVTLGLLNDLNAKANMSDTERRLRRFGSNYAVTIQGALVGCGVGILAGMAGRDGEFSEKAILDCILGAGAGATAGYILQQRVQQYGNEERAINSFINEARAENQEAEQLIESAEDVIAKDKAKIIQLRKKMNAKSVSVQDLEKERAAIQKNETYLKQTISAMKRRKKEWNDMAVEINNSNPDKAQQLRQEAAVLQTKISHLEKSVQTLVKQRRVSNV